MAISNVSTGIGTSRTNGVSNRELAVKVFSGEVMTAFETKNVFLPLVKTRTIPHGKSASFAVIGKYGTAVTEHVPGADVVPNLINAGERVIEIDALKYASVFVDRFEEAMQHFETRSTYAMEMGRKLAKEVDADIIAMLDSAVTGAANSGDQNGDEGQPYDGAAAWATSTSYVVGNLVKQSNIVYRCLIAHTSGTFATDLAAGKWEALSVFTVNTSAASTNGTKGDKILAALFDGQTVMDSEDIPGERYVVMSPKNYNRLVQSGAVNKDYTSGDNGGIDTGKINTVAGHRITVSNNVGVNDIYMFTSEAIGVVKLLDIKTEAEYLIEKQGTLMVSSYAMGFGILNNGCVIKMTTND